MKTKTCSICYKPLNDYGHNAEPLSLGRCCEKCHLEVVLASRVIWQASTSNYKNLLYNYRKSLKDINNE